MKKGINQWSLPEDSSVKENLELAASVGFDGVELCLKEEGEFSLSTSKKELNKLKDQAEEQDIELPSIATDLLWKYPLTSGKQNVRKKGKEIVKTMVKYADYLEANTVLVVPGTVENPFDSEVGIVSYDVAYERAQSALRELSGFAERKEVNLGIENVWNKFLLSPIEIRDFVDEIGSDYLKVYFDVGNVLQYGFPRHWIKILGDRICKVHVKDFKKDIGNIRGFTYLLQGDVEWPQVIRQLKELEYDDYLTAEVLPLYKHHPEKLAMDTATSLDMILDGEV